MLEILAIWYLCRLNAQNAESRGRSRAGAIGLTLTLWLGLELVAVTLMAALLGEYALSPLLLFAPLMAGVLGGVLSHQITSQGPPAAPAGFTPKEMADIRTSPQLAAPCYLTITNQGPGTATFALNGQLIGALPSRQSITVGTALAHNYLTATNAMGLRSRYPAAFTAASGGSAHISYRRGQFIVQHITG